MAVALLTFIINGGRHYILKKKIVVSLGGISSVQCDIDCYFCVVSKGKWIFNNITCILVVRREV